MRKILIMIWTEINATNIPVAAQNNKVTERGEDVEDDSEDEDSIDVNHSDLETKDIKIWICLVQGKARNQGQCKKKTI